MRPKIQVPSQQTISNWYAKYPTFEEIFEDADTAGLLLPLFIQFPEPTFMTYRWVFQYMLQYYSSRIVAPPMLFDSEKDLRTIGKIKDFIVLRAYQLKPKYDLLGETLPTDIEDYYENYRMSRQKTRKKEVKQGTITNSGNDTTFSNVHSTTTKTTSTGESETPRFDSATTTSTGDSNDNANNSVKTTYGRTITSNPGDEDISERTTAHGYYNSGTKADMIKEIRDILNFNLLNEWLKEMIPSFCCAYYDPAWSIPPELNPSEFIL